VTKGGLFWSPFPYESDGKVLSVAARKLKDDERRHRVITLWQERLLPEERAEHNVLAFFHWLEENHSELLGRGHGDAYQQLNVDLRDYTLRGAD
jgi:hypothetical protein